MNFNDYQIAAAKYDTFEAKSEVSDPSFIAKILGLAGESGEVAEKFKKILRDKEGKLSLEDKKEIAKELGDVLWYLAAISRYMGIEFEEVAEMNLDKLQGRLERDKIHGAGDNRQGSQWGQ